LPHPVVGAGCPAAGGAGQVFGHGLEVEIVQHDALGAGEHAGPLHRAPVFVATTRQDEGQPRRLVELPQRRLVQPGVDLVEAVEDRQDQAGVQQRRRPGELPVHRTVVREGQRRVAPGELVGQPGLQVRLGIPGLEAEQHRHPFAGLAAVEELAEQFTGEDALAGPGLAEDHQPPGRYPGVDLRDLLQSAAQVHPGRAGPHPRSADVRRLVDQARLGRMPGDRQRHRVTRPVLRPLPLPFGCHRHGQAVGEGRQVDVGGARGWPPVAPRLLPDHGHGEQDARRDHDPQPSAGQVHVLDEQARDQGERGGQRCFPDHRQP